MRTEVSIPDDLEAILVLAGENPKERPRSKKAIEVYGLHSRIPIILSGSHAGMHGQYPPRGEKKSCIQMQEYMMERGIEFGNIILENQSMSTLANFYYSRPIIEKLEATKVGLITDPIHFNRSMWCARKVFADTVEFVPIPSASNCGFSSPIQEHILKICTAIDLRVRGIKDGDYDALTKFMREVDPYHAQNYRNKPKISAHGLLVMTARAIKESWRYD